MLLLFKYTSTEELISLKPFLTECSYMFLELTWFLQKLVRALFLSLAYAIFSKLQKLRAGGISQRSLAGHMTWISFVTKPFLKYRKIK